MTNISPRSFKEFSEEAKKGNVVPVVRGIFSDLYTPVSAFIKIASNASESFLFESVEGSEKLTGYSFLAANPQFEVRSKEAKTYTEVNGKIESISEDTFFEHFRKYFSKHKLASREGLLPFCGGVAGYMAFESAHLFEKSLENDKYPDATDALWQFFRTVLIFDHKKQKADIATIVFTDVAEGSTDKLKSLYEQALLETQMIENLLKQPIERTDKVLDSNGASSAFATGWAKTQFENAVTEVQGKIAAGDCHQVTLSQKFIRETQAAPFDVYRALRTTNSSPYMFYLKSADGVLIGTSPEMNVSCKDGLIETHAVSGTRPRGETETEDWIIGEDMKSDEREIARHATMVDLKRGCLGNIAKNGSIEIDDLMKVEKYSGVQHLSTELRGELAEGLDALDALASFTPLPSMTGSPQISAAKIIADLEPSRRGAFSGTIGYLDYQGNLETCVATNLIEIMGKIATIHVGVQIEADASPERKYEETLSNARSFVKAIEIAETGI